MIKKQIRIKQLGKLSTIILGLLMGWVLFVVKPIFAQSSEIHLTVSPPISYLHVAPGTARNHTIILENKGNADITVLPTIVDFTTDGKTGGVIVTNKLSFPYVSMGVDNSVKEVSIPPGKKAQLTLYINVPKEAEEKEYPLSVLFFSKTELDANQTSNSQISAAIGSNLIVLVAKQNKFNKIFEVLDFNAPTFTDSFQKIEFSPSIKNNSLGAAVASGSAKIVNWRKQTITEFEVYPDVILGHNSRNVRALLSKSNPEQLEVGSFSYKPKFLLGPYQIVLTLLNEDNVEITQEIHVFYAFPVVVIVAVGIGLGIYLYFKKTIPKN
jgi:hypothetical protein